MVKPKRCSPLVSVPKTRHSPPVVFLRPQRLAGRGLCPAGARRPRSKGQVFGPRKREGRGPGAQIQAPIFGLEPAFNARPSTRLRLPALRVLMDFGAPETPKATWGTPGSAYQAPEPLGWFILSQEVLSRGVQEWTKGATSLVRCRTHALWFFWASPLARKLYPRNVELFDHSECAKADLTCRGVEPLPRFPPRMDFKRWNSRQSCHPICQVGDLLQNVIEPRQFSQTGEMIEQDSFAMAETCFFPPRSTPQPHSNYLGSRNM